MLVKTVGAICGFLEASVVGIFWMAVLCYFLDYWLSVLITIPLSILKINFFTRFNSTNLLDINPYQCIYPLYTTFFLLGILVSFIVVRYWITDYL